MSQKEEEDFFLPDLCQAQSILFLVLVTELLVFVLVLAQSRLVNFDWGELALSSLFIQWIVLTSSALLCNLRPLLKNMSIAAATTVGYLVILSLTLAFSIMAEWIMLGQFSEWDMSVVGDIGRNLIIASIMTGIAFRYFFLQQQLREQEKAELNSRIQALQSRIRPHFLFNSMNIIASLIAVDPVTAEEVVEDLSVLFRASLNDSSDEPVTLTEELDLCHKYAHIESLRLDDRLGIDWKIEVDTDAVRIPLLTLQPLLENAIYHGIQPLPEGGIVNVHIFEKRNQLYISLTNPIAKSGNTHEVGNRMALDNTRRRLEAIYGPEASLITEIIDTTFQTTISYPLNKTSQL